MKQISIGTALKLHRQQYELTVEDAARQIGTGPSSYERWESGEIIPNRKNRELIRDWLGLSKDAMGWLTWQTQLLHDRRKACGR